MNRIASIFAAFAVVALAGKAEAAADSYLYFLVDDAKYKIDEAVNFDYATVKMEGGESYLSLYSVDGTALGTEVASDGANSTAMADLGYGYYAGFTGDASAATFLVELWANGNDGTPLAYQAFAGAGLSQHIFSATTAGGSSPLTVTTVVPEPTSGLLLLLGASLLALRRKQKRL